MISTTPPSTCLQRENKAGKLKPLISTHPLPSDGPSSFAAMNSSPRPVDFCGFLWIYLCICRTLSVSSF